MQFTEMFLAELDREARGTRKVLERVPEGRGDWKPHPKSMNLGAVLQLSISRYSWPQRGLATGVSSGQAEHFVDELILTPHISPAHPSNLPLANMWIASYP